MMRSLRTMAWLVFLGCVSLWAGPALAKVAPFDACPGFFYRDVPPSGFETSDTKSICQRYSEEFHYATLYDRISRIPRWSAYTLDKSECSEEARRTYKWLVEPQLTDPEGSPNMIPEEKLGPELRQNQAINEDYENTAYEPGQLNPFSFQCKKSRKTTFTLTNAVAMDPHFHQLRWSKVEKSLKTRLTESCVRNGGSPYLVTGAVPGDVKIPIRSTDKEVNRDRIFDRVSVPSHVWTAVCCNHTDETEKFSFSILEENKEESRLQIIPVEKLNTELAHLYKFSEPVGIFADDCGSRNPKSQSVSLDVKLDVIDSFHIFFDDYYSLLLPEKERHRLDAKTIRVLRSKNLHEASMRLSHIEFMVAFRSLADWHHGYETLYKQDDLSCVLAPAAAGTTDRLCTLLEQKHVPGSIVTASGWSCVEEHCGSHSSAYSGCNTSYSRQCRSGRYECSRGDGTTVACSPQFSTVTISGKPCRADHPCGLYGEDSYWCYTDYKQNREDCCSPQGYCRKNGRDYDWCHIKDPENCWERCTP
nr:endonuclease domain-containing 1 protein-like [Pelodiscus sinensis]|eukprot:XP_006113261.1 endonuclease domain-containing 1 protein-like [Pelodiscus sinensis]